MLINNYLINVDMGFRVFVKCSSNWTQVSDSWRDDLATSTNRSTCYRNNNKNAGGQIVQSGTMLHRNKTKSPHSPSKYTSPVYILWIRLLQEGLHCCVLVFPLLKFTPAQSSKQQSQLLIYWTESWKPVNLPGSRIWLTMNLIALCTWSETWWFWWRVFGVFITHRGGGGFYPWSFFVIAHSSWIFLTWTDELNNISGLLNLSHIWAHSLI